MARSTVLRSRIAVGLAGALLGASLLGGLVSVSAADDGNPAQDRDRPAEQQVITGTLPLGGYAVQFNTMSAVTDNAAALPAQIINQADPRSDRN